MTRLTESDLEQYALEILEELGYSYCYGPNLAADGEQPERQGFDDIFLRERLRSAIDRINPAMPADAREQAFREALRISSPDLLSNNESFHRCLTDGVSLEYQKDGNTKGDQAWLIDFENPANNDFLVVNQFTIIENNQNKRPDILVFVNGIPLVVIELKNAAGETTTVTKAYEQIQTYKSTIPSLFSSNAFCLVSDGLESKAGTISSDLSRFMSWKSSDGVKEASRFAPQLEVMLRGMLQPAVLLDLVRHFIVFEKSKKIDPATGITQVLTIKKIAAYHQYYAVNKAIQSTLIATSDKGDRKGGVVWHTQGSGKSLSMVFYTGKLVLSLNNPTVVVITDRNDLDDQLFDTFANSTQLLRQEPVQAKDRTVLKDLLKVSSGGIVFTTVQKFMPTDGKSEYDLLSERKNIVVIADEAHRTQYGFEAKLVDVKDANTKEVIGKRIAYGFAKYMRDALPSATYIGFTGTPIESTDVNTTQVFGNYVDIYDIAQAVEDKATVRIYYESRLAKISLTDEGMELVKEFEKTEELIEWEDAEQEYAYAAQKAKSNWTRLEAIVGHPERLKNLAKDIVRHFELRQETFVGKAMIVAMSRRIAAALYEELVKLRPHWHSDDLKQGTLKVIMTTSSDEGPNLVKFHTTKSQRRDLADRMKDPSDGLKLVIVRDMWLTGFDAPSMHTLYIDKPMRGHNLMQAIARVNRVFKDKPGGLVVDYLGIGSDLKEALRFYSDAGGKGDPTENQQRAVEAFIEKLEVVRQFFQETSNSSEFIMAAEPGSYYKNSPDAGFNYGRFLTGTPAEKLSIILQAQEHVLGLDDGKSRFLKEVGLLSQAFALASPDETVLESKEEVAFFQAVRARLMKFESGLTLGRDDSNFYELNSAIKHIVDKALQSEEVVDIFDAAGIKKPEISILSEDFLLEIKGLKHKNLALELLRKILNDEIRVRSKFNMIQSKKLQEMLEGSINRYQNNLLSTAEIIQELIDLAKEVKEADKRGEKLNLKQDELAFYDALETNDSAVQVLGDDTLRDIAREIAEKVKSNATIDWTIKESARARLMVIVRRTLNKYGYPPDKQAKALETVMRQAEMLADFWVG